MSRRQIAEALGVRSEKLLTEWLRGVPPAGWTRRPNAKDDLRDKAVELRLEGRSYREIATVVGVSTSTLSLWLRDVALTDEQRAALDGRRLSAVQRRAEGRRSRRIRRQEFVKSQARSEIAELTGRELFVAGVVAYWAEGSKDKPWDRRERVVFANSDPDLVRLFLRWLELLGVSRDRVRFELQIHESADVAGALSFWAGVVGLPLERFSRPLLKRHNPKTVRKNTGAGYHGCLVVRVGRGTDLYRQIAGWWAGIVDGVGDVRIESPLPAAIAPGAERARAIGDRPKGRTTGFGPVNGGSSPPPRAADDGRTER